MRGPESIFSRGAWNALTARSNRLMAEKINSGGDWSRAAAVPVAASTIAAAATTALAADPSTMLGGFGTDASLATSDTVLDSLARANGAISYDGPYMDDYGAMRYPIKSISLDPLLILVMAFTRCGGILPDELPFNLAQKALRAILPDNWNIIDLADDDFRKAYQDTWYGTSEEAAWLPERMKSRRKHVSTRISSDLLARDESTEQAAGLGKAQTTETDGSGVVGPSHVE